MEVTRLFRNQMNILGDPILRSPDGKVMLFLCKPNRLRNHAYFATPPSGNLQMDWGTTRHPDGLQTSYRHEFCIWRSPNACAQRVFFVISSRDLQMQSFNMESIRNMATRSKVNGLGFSVLQKRVSGYMS